MRRDLNEQAKQLRAQVESHLLRAEECETAAVFWATLAGRLLHARLQRDVDTWKEVSCWATLDDETKREQGKALRSRELLEYFLGAEEASKAHRAEAERIAANLERAENDGRIPRI